MLRTFANAARSVAIQSAVIAAAAALPAYSLADYINQRSDPPQVSPSFNPNTGWDEFNGYRGEDGRITLASILPAFLAPSSKFYGCLPDLGQVDDGIAPTGSGIRMFVSATHGNDANDGLTKATAKQTLTAVLAGTNNSFKALQQPPTGSTIPDGSWVYLCRGDQFDGAISVRGGSATTPTSNYSFGCYSHTGDPPKPRPKVRYKTFNISGGQNVGDCFHIAGNATSPAIGPTVIQNIDFDVLNSVGVFYSGLSGGTPTVGDVITCARTGCTATLADIPSVASASFIVCQGFVLPGTPTGTSIGHGIQSGDTITSNTGWTATTGTINANSGFFCAQVINVTMQFCSVVNASGNGISPTGFSTVTAANFVMRHIYLQDCQTVIKNGAGIGGGGGTNITYDHITAVTCGRDPIFSHGTYIVGAYNPSSITFCYVYGSANNGVTEHGGGSGFTIADNFFDANGNGMGMGPGFGTGGENVINSFILRNIVLNSGTRSPYTGSTAFGVGIGVSMWINGLIQNNLVVGSAGFGMIFQSETGFGDTQNSLTIYNNTVEAPAGAYAVYFRAKNGTAQHQVSLDFRNNILSANDATLYALFKDVTELIPLASVTMDGNHWFMKNKASSASVGSIINWDSTAYTLVAFNTFDATKETTQNYGDPQFINPVATTIGSLPNGKKCGGTYRQVSAGKKTGVSIGVTSDLNGNPRSAQNPGCYA